MSGVLKRKRDVVECQIGVAKELDGSLSLTWRGVTTNIRKRTVDLLIDKDLRVYKQMDKWNVYDGYICWKRVRIHHIFNDLLDGEKWNDYFSKHPKDRMVIGHLDDNKLNFNIENLQKIPQSLNLLSRKSIPCKWKSGTFGGNVGFENKVYFTKAVSTVEEAKHATDILKLWMAPEHFRDYLLLHAMHRPPAYKDRYFSVENLLLYAKEYKPRNMKTPKPRENKNQYIVWRSIEEALEHLPDIHAATVRGIFSTTGIVPFSEVNDAVVHYIGARGKELVFLVDYEFYAQHLKDARPGISVNTAGYLQMFFGGKQRMLHLAVMGREVWQTEKDGKLGGHGAGKVLDNRSRVLKPLSPAENSSDVGFRLKSAPEAVGVCWRKRESKWYVQINSFFTLGDNIFLGYAIEKETASLYYQFAYANKEYFKYTCKDMNAKKRNKYLRRCCALQKLLNVPNV